MNRIGTVEILKQRIYNLDPECHGNLCSTVVVEPGRYDLYDDHGAKFWLMHGRLNQRGTWRMGDGLFGLHFGDTPSEVEVTFPSRRFGPDEWAALLASPEFTDGSETQRLRVAIEAVQR